MLRIAQENQRIQLKLSQCKPFYVRAWHEDWLKTTEVMERISHYPHDRENQQKVSFSFFLVCIKAALHSLTSMLYMLLFHTICTNQIKCGLMCHCQGQEKSSKVSRKCGAKQKKKNEQQGRGCRNTDTFKTNALPNEKRNERKKSQDTP